MANNNIYYSNNKENNKNINNQTGNENFGRPLDNDPNKLYGIYN